MIFETERLIIRPWEESDSTSLYEYAKDPLVGPIAGWPIHKSIEDSLNVIKYVLKNDDTFAVCLKEDNVAIGSIGIIKPTQAHSAISNDEVEIGYWIGVPFWGRGLIPEGVKRIIEYCFNDLKVKGIWCGYYDGNIKSKRCQEKCGFKYHHTEYDKPCTIMNDIRIEHYTYLSKEEWLKNI